MTSDPIPCHWAHPHGSHDWAPLVGDPAHPRVLHLGLATVTCPGTRRHDLLPDDWTTVWDAETVFPFVEDENCNITGYGHQDLAEFAEAINRYDEAAMGDTVSEDERWTADDVGHAYAVLDDDHERLYVSTGGVPVTAETPGAVPITYLWGQR